MSLLTLDGVACTAADGTRLFSGLSLAVNSEVVGVVGRNGSGKTTLLRAIAGEIPFAAGTMVRHGRVGFLRQLPDNPDTNVEQVLGVRTEIERLRRIELGAGTDSDYELADWTFAQRLRGALGSVKLDEAILPRAFCTLSGGEQTRVRIAAMLLREPDLVLLDEPTNNLDEEGRQAVRNLLEDWRGAAIVASHDRELLEHADRIVELSSVGVFIVGGSWREFEEARQAELERRKAELERRKRELKTAIRDRQRETEKQARRDKYGRKVASKDIDPRPYLFRQQQKAEKTAARYQQVGEDLVERAREQLNAAQAQVELLSPVRISLPRSGLASKHQLVRARGLVCERGGRRLFGPLDFDIRGPERIALQGPNGAGKTSLIRLIAGVDQPVAGELRADRFRIALLDQHLSLLGTSGTAAEAMRRLNPQMRDNEVHAALAAYGFRSRWGERALETLSGGERMRLALACLFSSPKPPQLLLLDEPTNHLDIASLEMLEAALESYDGALLCVSHDKVFLQAIGVSRSLDLSRRASPVTDGR